jgi:hypothetical protein
MIRVTDKQFWMDELLLTPINTYCYNISGGHDFMIIITGSAKKRVGKTMLATQVGCYAGWVLGTPFDESNVAFGGRELIEIAKSHPHKSVIIDDESRTDLSSKRQMERFNKDLMDFFSECGKLNDLIILVAPDYFEFSKSVAVNMSDLLINIRREKSDPIKLTERQISESGLNLPVGTEVVKIIRGNWDIYDAECKKKLYIWGKKNFDEYTTKYRSTYGEFRLFWPIDTAKYEARKDAFIARDRSRASTGKLELRVRDIVKKLMDAGWKQKDIAQLLGFTEAYISKCKQIDLTVNS